jgi:hypothetical protein
MPINLNLIQRLVNMVQLAWIRGKTLLICVDGLACYPTAFWLAFRQKVLTGRRGRPSFQLPGCVGNTVSPGET